MIETFDFTLRYQRTPCARYHVRPLTLLQQEVMYRCDGNVTVADLADATKCSHPEVRAILSFLLTHGLVKTLPPEAWLFGPPPQKQPSRPPELPPRHASRARRPFWQRLRGRFLTPAI